VNNQVWRVTKIVEIFRTNIQKFGFFSSKLSIDESMIKFFGRLDIKQYVRIKPIRFGIKLWALCTIFGFLHDFSIYCGKNENVQNLKKCNLGSRVVLNMLHQFLMTVPNKKLKDYHVL